LKGTGIGGFPTFDAEIFESCKLMGKRRKIHAGSN
jgi:hypothetical protein